MHARQRPRSLDRATSIFPQPGRPLLSPPWALARRSGLAPDRPPLRPSPEREPASSSLSSEPRPPCPVLGTCTQLGVQRSWGSGGWLVSVQSPSLGHGGGPAAGNQGSHPIPSSALPSVLLMSWIPFFRLPPCPLLQPCSPEPGALRAGAAEEVLTQLEMGSAPMF